MSHDFAAAARTAYMTFYETFAAHAAWYRPLTDTLVEDAPHFKESDIHGLTKYAAQVASPTPKTLRSSGSTTSSASFEETVKLTNKQVRDNPGILVSVAAELAELGAWTLVDAFVTAITTADVTTHPENGGSVYAATGGGTVFFVDAFDMTPPNAAAFSQQNLFTTAWGDDALDAMLAARHGYKNKSGNPYHMGQKPMVIHPSELTGEVENLLGRTAEIYDGTSLQLGAFGKRVQGNIVLPGDAADANDFFLWWRKELRSQTGEVRSWGPIVPWLRSAPSVRFTPSDDTNHVNVVAEMEYGIHYRTFEGDMSMAKVA